MLSSLFIALNTCPFCSDLIIEWIRLYTSETMDQVILHNISIYIYGYVFGWPFWLNSAEFIDVLFECLQWPEFTANLPALGNFNINSSFFKKFDYSSAMVLFSSFLEFLFRHLFLLGTIVLLSTFTIHYKPFACLAIAVRIMGESSSLLLLIVFDTTQY